MEKEDPVLVRRGLRQAIERACTPIIADFTCSGSAYIFAETGRTF
ncbi:MAG: hypothetical protein Q8L68_07640 [Methylococcales bacterium]|nr:hypothetical protein [Methylococcales bacterium]